MLPAPDTSHPLRFCDTGIIRSASLQSDGYHIALDRTYPTSNQNQNPVTYPYVIPRTLVTGPAPAVGDDITVYTNGRVVTSY